MSTGPRHPRAPRSAGGRSAGYVAALYGDAPLTEWLDRYRLRIAPALAAPVDLRSPSLVGLAHPRAEPTESLGGVEALVEVERIVSDGFVSIGRARPALATVGAGSLLRRRTSPDVEHPVSVALVEGGVVLVEGLGSPPRGVPLPPERVRDARETLDVSLVASSVRAAEWLLATDGVFRPYGSDSFYFRPTRESVVSDEVLDDLLRRTDALDAGLASSYALADDAFSRLPSGLEVTARHARRVEALLDLAEDGTPAEWATRRLGPGDPEW